MLLHVIEAANVKFVKHRKVSQVNIHPVDVSGMAMLFRVKVNLLSSELLILATGDLYLTNKTSYN